MKISKWDLISLKVSVYWNLHKRLFSLKYNGRVVTHTNHLCLLHPHFIVNQSGRARVLRERRKNVHAYIRGTLARFTYNDNFILSCISSSPIGVKYNPYERDCFFSLEDGCAVRTADLALLNAGGVVAYRI